MSACRDRTWWCPPWHDGTAAVALLGVAGGLVLGALLSLRQAEVRIRPAFVVAPRTAGLWTKTARVQRNQARTRRAYSLRRSWYLVGWWAKKIGAFLLVGSSASERERQRFPCAERRVVAAS